MMGLFNSVPCAQSKMKTTNWPSDAYCRRMQCHLSRKWVASEAGVTRRRDEAGREVLRQKLQQPLLTFFDFSIFVFVCQAQRISELHSMHCVAVAVGVGVAGHGQ